MTEDEVKVLEANLSVLGGIRDGKGKIWRIPVKWKDSDVIVHIVGTPSRQFRAHISVYGDPYVDFNYNHNKLKSAEMQPTLDRIVEILTGDMK